MHANDICLEDITISLIKERKPRELFKWFTNHGYIICEKYPGIYYVNKDGNFPIQVIVSSRLSVENQKWLTLLSSHLSKVPVTKKDVTENGAIVELIGPFPYFINFQPLDGEQLVPLIEKSTQKR